MTPAISPHSPTPAPAAPLDKTSQAFVGCLLGDADSQLDAFCHLRAILLTATAGLYLPEDERTAGPLREQSARFDAAQEFIVEALAVYRGLPPEEILAAAHSGAFRHLANRFRSRFLNKIRDSQAAKRQATFVTFEEAAQLEQRSLPARVRDRCRPYAPPRRPRD